MKFIITLTLLAIQFNVMAKLTPTGTVNGTVDERNQIYALTNAHIFVDSQTSIEQGTILVQNNKVLNVGKQISIPQNAMVRDLNGAFIYPSFILLESNYGLSEIPKKVPFSWSSKEVLNTTTKGAVNTNEAIKASYKAVSDFSHVKDDASKLRNLGFGMVLSSQPDGIMRGTSMLVNLDDASDNNSIITPEQAFHLSFDKGSSKQLYPVSLMGSSALLRQTWLDADWYGQGKEGFTDLDLQAVNETHSKMQIFSVNNWQQALLADKISREFSKDIVIKSAGDEYKHIDAIKKLKRSLIVPLVMPKAMDIKDELDAWNVSSEKLMEWEAAPYNLYYLNKNDIEFAIVPNQHKTFIKDLRKAIKKGLPKSAALAALTSTPAKMLSNKNLGHLKRGAHANFIVTEGDMFEEGGKLAENWIAGKRFVISQLSKIQTGAYQLTLEGEEHEINITASDNKLKINSSDNESPYKYKAELNNGFVQLEITGGDKDQRLLGLVDLNAFSSIQGQKPQWAAKRISDIKKADEKSDASESTTSNNEDKMALKNESKTVEPPVIAQPFSPYGLFKPNTSDSFLIKNTTVWTNEDDGVLEKTDVYIENGKIKNIGQNLNIKADETIDGTQMHLTAGIIDEHSHIALLSVNDVMVNSSMVRMEDVLDSDSVNIYRNLSGGVTAAQLLHGSANPFGGQSALIKMRWGATSDELLIKGADKFIKFALGENVKRSSSQSSIRFPQTRMGVEQVYRDAFTNALEYEKQWQTYNKMSKRSQKKASAPRRDLMMDATLEVINKNRFITSHSYVQSEIKMLMQVAEDYGFNVNTFTHILEGYKVADDMLRHGVGASTFSDWWSFKWEVNYAIPYNASIMTKLGVVTAINSDDSEMARRLNQEAAKSIKYGGLSEEQALKLVTLNPAKLLHLDDRMGSIKVGKDADIVLWSDNPMSIYAKANKTFVDGKLLFDRDRQVEIENQITENRMRIINKMNGSDGPKIPASNSIEKHMHCDSLTGYEYLMGAIQ
ncbi:MAG: amidohydrolase family protein [Marinicellaceae bacterium]